MIWRRREGHVRRFREPKCENFARNHLTAHSAGHVESTAYYLARPNEHLPPKQRVRKSAGIHGPEVIDSIRTEFRTDLSEYLLIGSFESLNRRIMQECGPVAQRIEHAPPKRGVAGSNPAGAATSSPAAFSPSLDSLRPWHSLSAPWAGRIPAPSRGTSTKKGGTDLLSYRAAVCHRAC